MFGGIKKTKCEKCTRNISNNNFQRHYDSCDGIYFTGPNRKVKKTNEEIIKSKLRNKQHLNKVRPQYKLGHIAWNKGLTKETDKRIAKSAEKLSTRYKNNEIKLSGVAALSFDQRSKNAIKQQFGGYNKNAGRSKKFKYIDSFGKNVCLQSSYEFRCAELLDKLKIRWIRPKHIKYQIDNKIKRYFPDFYLTEYDLYLDPKNDYLAKIDAKKIKLVSEQNNIKIYILTDDKITKEYLGSIAQW